MNLSISLLRRQAYHLGRAVFRSLPLSDGQRDRLRALFLSRAGHWVPQPQQGQVSSQSCTGQQPRLRADEPAIGHVAHGRAALPEPMPATLVAFYLPQFHTFAENDAWWGKGFTEWRNVTRALPQFEGHVQPRLPADLGFYDLRNPQVMRDQARLAAEYGIGAFCFYFYWFSGRTLMEVPLRQWLDDASIELPFCLCWANENWARRWDGRDHDILIAQQHSAEDDLAFIAHVADYLRDRRALKVDGKPMLLVYRPHLLPDARATATRWRSWCRDNGIGEIHLAYVQGFERPDPRDIGFDAAVEFPPNMSNPRDIGGQQRLLNPDFRGDVRDWRELADDMGSRPLPAYTLYPGVNPGWDNEARRSGKGRIYLHASPRGYRDWLARTIHQRLKGVPANQRMVFINAWNEWAEGAVLEPDARLGHAWLEATRQALLPPESRMTRAVRPCVVIHAWYAEEFGQILQALQRTGLDWRIVVTTSPERVDQIRQVASGLGASMELHIHPNHGRDILPFLHCAERLLEAGEPVVLKLHTKRSTHREDGDQWLRDLLEKLIAGGRAEAIIKAFSDQTKLGCVAPEGHVQPLSYFWGANESNVTSLHTRFGIPAVDLEAGTFIAGSMFWIRLQALRPLLDAHLNPSLFEAESGQVDGTLAHAVERVISTTVKHAGYQQQLACEIVSEDWHDDTGYAYAERG